MSLVTALFDSSKCLLREKHNDLNLHKHLTGVELRAYSFLQGVLLTPSPDSIVF